MEMKKESYVEPTLVMHDMLRDITAVASGKGGDCVKSLDSTCLR